MSKHFHDDEAPRPRTVHRALNTEEAELLLRLKAGEWGAIKRDVERGSRRFWAKRGMREPGGAGAGGFEGMAKVEVAAQVAAAAKERKEEV